MSFPAIVVLMALCASQAAWPQTARQDDPFEDQMRSQEAAEKDWQSAHRDLYAKIHTMDTCRPEFHDSIQSVQLKMIAAFRARRDYVSHWLELVRRRATDSEQVQLSVPGHAARLRKDLERASDLSQDAQRRREELIAAGHAKDSPEVKAAGDLSEATGKEAAEIRELLDQLQAERLELMAAADRHRVLVETLLKRLKIAVTEQGLWDNLYHAQLDRGRLACREGFK